MSERSVLVKRLQGVEALGQAKIIAVDKTGTITKNQLAVVAAVTLHDHYAVAANGYQVAGAITSSSKKESPHALDWLARSCMLTSGAQILTAEDGTVTIEGDPTEAALQVFAKKCGIEQGEITARLPLVRDEGFDYTRKYHEVVHKSSRGYLVSVAGAPDVLLDQMQLSENEHVMIRQQQERLSRLGMRVIVLGHLVVRESPKVGAHHHYHFDGLVGMQDTLHDGLQKTIATLHDAGVSVVMITGDHPITAHALAVQAGILENNSSSHQVLSGDVLERMSDEELVTASASVRVFARVSPEHKLRIVHAFQKAGYVTAMTGDGVNDAPALTAADLGIALGIRGTEVAKDAADIVLLDDNLSSIATGIEEGRSIYASIQRVVTYLFSGSFSLVTILVISAVLFRATPIAPSQVIWLNFVTDVVLVLALTSERTREGLLTRRYVHPTGLITRDTLRRIFGLTTPSIILISIVLATMQGSLETDRSRTAILTILAVTHWAFAWNVRSKDTSLFSAGFARSNPQLIEVTILAFILQLTAVYVPVFQQVLHTTALPLGTWLIAFAIAASCIAAEEVRKYFRRHR
jgi:Ca2+-transporting ATPase